MVCRVDWIFYDWDFHPWCVRYAFFPHYLLLWGILLLSRLDQLLLALRCLWITSFYSSFIWVALISREEECIRHSAPEVRQVLLDDVGGIVCTFGALVWQPNQNCLSLSRRFLLGRLLSCELVHGVHFFHYVYCEGGLLWLQVVLGWLWWLTLTVIRAIMV